MFHLSDDDDDGRSSVLSSSASSSFSSGRRCSDVDYRDCPPQSEVEEIPSFRWLMSRSPVPKPPPERAEVDWGHLVSAKSKPGVDKITENHWVVLVDEETSGRRCALVLAPGLEIRWQDQKTTCWRYHAGAAVLREVCWLDIRAKVDAADLFPQTDCVCVLVFQLLPTAFGLGLGGETQEAWVSVGGRLASERTVRLQPEAGDGKSSDVAGSGGPRRRRDGWLEIELGRFSAGKFAFGGEVLVEMGLREVERLGQAKGGLVVRGVEVRPRRFAAGRKREGTARVSSVLCPRWDLPNVDAQPFSVGSCWMLSCWMAPIAMTRMLDGGGSEPYPDRILQLSYADWVPGIWLRLYWNHNRNQNRKRNTELALQLRSWVSGSDSYAQLPDRFDCALLHAFRVHNIQTHA
ncbi:hypothetical protein Taro_007611 [Colocasia esculenta]|uniref:Uncharacterized protein n=1 Tax=Colocasia esculenta TaxID=4460 RepID=A0A843U0W8_COLES|nr:hypothetical protein [Colocasia esculenta]